MSTRCRICDVDDLVMGEDVCHDCYSEIQVAVDWYDFDINRLADIVFPEDKEDQGDGKKQARRYE